MGVSGRMTSKELMRLKARLLCYGVKSDSKTRKIMTDVNPYVIEKGFVHAAHFQIDDMIINACMEDRFCKKSPFSIEYRGGVLSLMEGGAFVCEIKVLELPDWCKIMVEGHCIGKYLRPHSMQCISFWPYLQCAYYQEGKQCKFCSLGEYMRYYSLSDAILPLPVAQEMLYHALRFNPQYEVALSGGTCVGSDHSILYYSEICERACSYGANYTTAAAPQSTGNGKKRR